MKSTLVSLIISTLLVIFSVTSMVMFLTKDVVANEYYVSTLCLNIEVVILSLALLIKDLTLYISKKENTHDS